MKFGDSTPILHALIRTSAKGADFVGTCMNCGEKGLTTKSMNRACKNVAGRTQEETLIKVIEEL